MKHIIIECFYNGMCAVKAYLTSPNKEDKHVRGVFIDYYSIIDIINHIPYPEYSLEKYPELLKLYNERLQDGIPRT